MRGRLGWIRWHLLSRCLRCSWKYIHPALLPKPLGDLQRIDVQVLPPDYFIAGLMQLSMVTTAKRYGEFVTDFETKGSGLGKPQVMRIRRLTTADEARL